MTRRNHSTSNDAYASAYDAAAKRDLGFIALFAAALLICFAIFDAFVHGEDHLAARLSTSLVPAALLTGLAYWARHRLPARMAPWAVAVAGLITLSGPLATVALTDHASDLGYAMLVIGAVGAVTYRRRPYWTFTVLALVMYTATAATAPVSEDTLTDWLGTGLMAAGLGAALFTARRHTVRSMADVNERLTFMADHDVLTGLVNRRGLETAGPTVLALARREGRTVFAAFVDIDRLSEINNDYGHGSGDEVIRTVADALRDTVREADVVARWGGDEIVLVGIGEGPDPHRIEEAVRDHAVRNSAVPGWDGQVSVGVTALPSSDTTFEALVLSADSAMYDRRGRRRSGAA
ncbi:MAG: hypothetical protein RL531_2175 [Actinomycetota bacterium]